VATLMILLLLLT